jgi:hypothetical protein
VQRVRAISRGETSNLSPEQMKIVRDTAKDALKVSKAEMGRSGKNFDTRFEGETDPTFGKVRASMFGDRSADAAPPAGKPKTPAPPVAPPSARARGEGRARLGQGQPARPARRRDPRPSRSEVTWPPSSPGAPGLPTLREK